MRMRSFRAAISIAAAVVGCQKESPRSAPSEEPERPSPSLSASATVESAHVETAVASSSAAPELEAPTEVDKAELAKKLQNAPLGVEQEVAKGVFMTVRRVNATNPIAGGWHHAASTRGGFSVDFPCPFNEMDTRVQAMDGVEVLSTTMAGKTGESLAWTASCIARRDGKLKDNADVRESVEPLGTPVRAWKRTVPFPDRICFLIVEAQGADPLPPEADRKRFLSSIKKTGPVVW